MAGLGFRRVLAAVAAVALGTGGGADRDRRRPASAEQAAGLAHPRVHGQRLVVGSSARPRHRRDGQRQPLWRQLHRVRRQLRGVRTVLRLAATCRRPTRRSSSRSRAARPWSRSASASSTAARRRRSAGSSRRRLRAHPDRAHGAGRVGPRARAGRASPSTRTSRRPGRPAHRPTSTPPSSATAIDAGLAAAGARSARPARPRRLPDGQLRSRLRGLRDRRLPHRLGGAGARTRPRLRLLRRVRRPVGATYRRSSTGSPTGSSATSTAQSPDRRRHDDVEPDRSRRWPRHSTRRWRTSRRRRRSTWRRTRSATSRPPLDGFRYGVHAATTGPASSTSASTSAASTASAGAVLAARDTLRDRARRRRRRPGRHGVVRRRTGLTVYFPTSRGSTTPRYDSQPTAQMWRPFLELVLRRPGRGRAPDRHRLRQRVAVGRRRSATASTRSPRRSRPTSPARSNCWPRSPTPAGSSTTSRPTPGRSSTAGRRRSLYPSLTTVSDGSKSAVPFTRYVREDDGWHGYSQFTLQRADGSIANLNWDRGEPTPVRSRSSTPTARSSATRRPPATSPIRS